MGRVTRIAWCDHTFSPVWGCSHVSPGCVRCYAETFAKRTGHDVWGAKGERRTFGEKHWAEPLAWNRAAQEAGIRRRVFCASMADVFEDHPQLPAERAKLWALIEATPWLDWLLLTKRPENVMGMVPMKWLPAFPENVWVGTSVENQEWVDKRIPVLLQIPAVVRFLSCEPLIGPVELRRWARDWDDHVEAFECQSHGLTDCDQLPECRGLQWVIVGGESGHGARPMHPYWAASLIAQCREDGVPVLFKQTGSVLAREWHLKDSKGEDLSEWPEDLRVQQWPAPLNLGQAALL